GDVIALSLPMQPRRVYANPHVRADIGKVAIMRGPIVYCLEQVDNGALVEALCLARNAELSEAAQPDKLGGIIEIHAAGKRLVSSSDALYSDEAPALEDAELTFIPYYTWANRGENEMTVFVREI
ncbi:MAG: glycoside hydrolase family 127 protein, partial [Christensenellales bacterium]